MQFRDLVIERNGYTEQFICHVPGPGHAIIFAATLHEMEEKLDQLDAHLATLKEKQNVVTDTSRR